MKKISVSYRSDSCSIAPDKLVLSCNMQDLIKIKDTINALFDSGVDVKSIFSINLNVSLYTTENREEWTWDTTYLTIYLPKHKGDSFSMYQYFQNKYDSSDNIESSGIDFISLERYLTKNVVGDQMSLA